MNITIYCDRAIKITVGMTFIDTSYHSAYVITSGYDHVPTVIAVIGRTYKEVLNLWLEYDGMRYLYPAMPDRNGHDLAPINISGKRDYWSQLLRNKAMSYTGPTDPDDIAYLESLDD